MGAASTLLSVVVLTAALMCVVAFAFAVHGVRYLYLQHLESRVAGTLEAVSVGVWHSGSAVVIDVRNAGGTPVRVRSLRAVVQYAARYGEELRGGSLVKSFGELRLPPLGRRLLAFDVASEPGGPRGADEVRVVSVSVVVATERNALVFDPAPPADLVVLEVGREDVGRSIAVRLPDGGRALFTVYEYLVCGVGAPSRLGTPVSRVEAARVWVARGEGEVEWGLYVYGYDWEARRFPEVEIEVYREEVGGREVTVCEIVSRGAPLSGRLAALSRGVVLLGTQLRGFDVIAFSFAGAPHPRPASCGGELRLVEGRAQSYVLKIPLPDRGVTVMDFLGPQVVPWGVAPDRGSAISIGTHYSQALLVGQSYAARLAGSGTQARICAEFDDPYPILLVIAPPQLEPTRG